MHHPPASDTTGNAIRYNAWQAREEKPALICGICKPLQTPATPELSLVAGAGKRFESARRLSRNPIDKPNTRQKQTSIGYWGLCTPTRTPTWRGCVSGPLHDLFPRKLYCTHVRNCNTRVRHSK